MACPFSALRLAHLVDTKKITKTSMRPKLDPELVKLRSGANKWDKTGKEIAIGNLMAMCPELDAEVLRMMSFDDLVKLEACAQMVAEKKRHLVEHHR